MERKIKQQLEPARLLLLFWQVVLLLPGCLAAFGGFAAAPKLAIGLSAPCSSLLIISGSWCSQTGSGVIGCSLSVRLPCLTLELEQTCTGSLKNVQKCNVLTRLVPRKNADAEYKETLLLWPESRASVGSVGRPHLDKAWLLNTQL